MNAEPWKKWTLEQVTEAAHNAGMRGEDQACQILHDFAGLIEQMRSTPPAKEPVSVELTVYMHKGWDYSGEFVDLSREEFKKGDRVRVVKIEETT